MLTKHLHTMMDGVFAAHAAVRALPDGASALACTGRFLS